MSCEQTKARLIEAAGEEFAEKGFDGATVRAICTKAGTNLAAVNYHFGDKVNLYEQAVMQAHRCGSFAEMEAIFDGRHPADQFRSYVRWFLMSVFDESNHQGWHRSLMLRELLYPTTASDTIVREAIRPRFDRLRGLLRAFCPSTDEQRLNALAFSVVGQILHYKFARSISERLIGKDAYQQFDPDFLTDHIANFCLAALGQIPPLNSEGAAVSPSSIALESESEEAACTGSR